MIDPPLCSAARFVDDGVLVATLELPEIRETAVAHALRDELIALVGSAHTQHLVIDARNVVLMASAGFLAFLGVRRRLEGRIVLCHLAPQVRETFEICRMLSSDSVAAPFEATETVEQALERIAECPQ